MVFGNWIDNRNPKAGGLIAVLCAAAAARFPSPMGGAVLSWIPLLRLSSANSTWVLVAVSSVLGFLVGFVGLAVIRLVRKPPGKRWIISLKNMVSRTSEIDIARNEGKLAPRKFVLEPYTPDWWDRFNKESALVMRLLAERGLTKYLAGPLEDKYASLLPKEQVNDGRPVMIGSSSVRGIELSTPFLDCALRVKCNPWDLPPEFAEAMREAGYLCFGASVHNPNGEDMWWWREPTKEGNKPDPSWPQWKQDRYVEKHGGYDFHCIGPSCSDFLIKALSFARYLEINDAARAKYVAYKRKHWDNFQKPFSQRTEKEKKMSDSDFFSQYKMGKQTMALPLQRDAMEYAEKHFIKQ